MPPSCGRTLGAAAAFRTHRSKPINFKQLFHQIRLAEDQMRIAVMVRAAVHHDNCGFTAPVLWAENGRVFQRAELELSPRHSQRAAACLEFTAACALAVAVKETLDSVFRRKGIENCISGGDKKEKEKKALLEHVERECSTRNPPCAVKQKLYAAFPKIKSNLGARQKHDQKDRLVAYIATTCRNRKPSWPWPGSSAKLLADSSAGEIQASKQIIDVISNAVLIARLIRNAYSHGLFAATWDVPDYLQGEDLAIKFESLEPNGKPTVVISVPTNTGVLDQMGKRYPLHKSPFELEHVGGPLALLHFCQVVRDALRALLEP